MAFTPHFSFFMSMDEVTLCNLALSRLGSRGITTLNDASAEAKACALHYDQVRDELLRLHPWNFARARTTLNKMVPTPSFVFGYAYVYALPDDCLRVMSINEADVWSNPSEEYEIEGRIILTNAETVQLKYVGRITNPDFYDPLFTKVMVVDLASVIAEKVTGNPQMAQALTQEKEQLLLGVAKKIDANESRSRHSTLPNINTSGFIRARFSGQ